ncbi:hypothetical protein GGX14DRAFT_442649, partial [Mycena pura]
PAERITAPSTEWNTKLATFTLCIPKAEPVSQAKLDASYDKCFEYMFDPERQPETASDEHPPTSVTRLPVLDALARPPELFRLSGPYILVFEERGLQIVVQCSHEPSLELLAGYLTKWGKPNPMDSEKRNILKVELLESEYHYGMIDTLTIERNLGVTREPLNPTLVLAFIEGVLGYKLTSTNGSCRTYTSTTLLN